MAGRDFYARFSKAVARLAGRPSTFSLAVALIAVWVVTGPLFGFSDSWQLVINTGTTIITFLMVFLIQNAQNRDTEALQLKLDEIIRSLDKAEDAVMDLEMKDDEELESLHEDYMKLARKARLKKNGKTAKKGE